MRKWLNPVCCSQPPLNRKDRLVSKICLSDCGFLREYARASTRSGSGTGQNVPKLNLNGSGNRACGRTRHADPGERPDTAPWSLGKRGRGKCWLRKETRKLFRHSKGFRASQSPINRRPAATGHVGLCQKQKNEKSQARERIEEIEWLDDHRDEVVFDKNGKPLTPVETREQELLKRVSSARWSITTSGTWDRTRHISSANLGL